MGPAGRKGQFKTRAGARLPAVRPTGPRRRTHSPQTKDPQVGGRGGGRGPPSDRPAGPAPSAVPVPSHASYGSFPSRIAEGQEPSASREAAGGFCGSASPPTPAPRQQGGLHPPQLVLLRLLCGADAGRAAGWEPAGLGDGSPVPGSDLEGRGGPARVHLRPGHPPASQSALGRHDARERVPPSSAHVLRGPHATARRSESEHSPHGFPREAPFRLTAPRPHYSDVTTVSLLSIILQFD